MRPVVLYNHSKKLGRSLEPFLGKGKKSNKNTCFGYLISYNPGLRFQKHHFAQTIGLITLFTYANSWEILGPVLEKMIHLKTDILINRQR